MSTKVKYFVSHAHRNRVLVADFLDRLADVLAPSKSFRYDRWIDADLILGEDWDVQIRTAVDQCNFGLLLISPAFLASPYIVKSELPRFISGEKSSVPVMLQPVDFKLHDLKGLERQQIFRFDNPEFSKPRAYGECSDDQRDAFVLDLFRKIEKKLRLSLKQTVAPDELDPVHDLRLFEQASKAYKKRGTPKFFLDSQNLSRVQKADLYDRVVLEIRGRPAKNNPYRKEEG